ncbi:hypothetical protein LguiA_035395 [Lonicera macranthoides]
MGVRIKDLGPNLFIFQFFNENERDRIYNKGPWSFEQNLVVMKKVDEGVNYRSIPLFYMDIWVQLHDIPGGLMSYKVGVDMANAIDTCGTRINLVFNLTVKERNKHGVPKQENISYVTESSRRSSVIHS